MVEIIVKFDKEVGEADVMKQIARVGPLLEVIYTYVVRPLRS